MATEWTKAVGHIAPSGILALDTETVLIDDNKPDNWDNIPQLIITFAYTEHGRFWIRNDNLKDFLKTHVKCEFIWHNVAFDFFVIKKALNQGLRFFNLAKKSRDTLLIQRLWHIAEKGYDSPKWSLEFCCKEHLGRDINKDADHELRTSFGDFLMNGIVRYDLITPEHIRYGGDDVENTWDLYHKFLDIFENNDIQENEWGFLTDKIQVRAAIALRQIQINGMRVDRKLVDSHLATLRKYKQELVDNLEAQGYWPGKGSGQRMQDILSDIEKHSEGQIKFPRTANSKKISTAADDILPYSDVHPFLKTYTDSIKVNKVIKTYLEKMENKDMVHPRINPIVNTGRTSSGGGFDGINSQNFPRDAILGCDIRNCFLPHEGDYLFAIDYSQIELVVLSQICLAQFGHSRMAELINAGMDVHRYLASKIYNVPEDEVTDVQRQSAKACNFGFPGMLGPAKMVTMAKSTYGVEWTVAEAAELKEFWLNTFPEMKEWVKTNNDTLFDRYQLGTTQWHLDNKGIAGALFLRIASGERASRQGKPYSGGTIMWAFDRMWQNREHIPDKFYDDIMKRKGSLDLKQALSKVHSTDTLTGRIRTNVGVNAAKNTKFQGLAADVAKLATFDLVAAGYKVCNFIHDEDLISIPKQDATLENARKIESLFLDATKLLLPDMRAKAEFTLSDRWAKKAKTIIEDGELKPFIVQL